MPLVEILIVLALVLLNGYFAMSELAVVSARPARLEALARKGSRGARLARDIWDDSGFAEQLEGQAADLKRRFNRDFWVADGEYFALALDPDEKLRGDVEDMLSAISNATGEPWDEGMVERAAPRPR